jgi:hypothetical protein
VNDELERLGKKWYGLIKVKLSQLPENTEENHNNPVRIVGIPAEIHARHFLTTSSECYFYTNMLKISITNQEMRLHHCNTKHQHAGRAAQNTVTTE